MGRVEPLPLKGELLASGGILETWWSHLNALAPFLSFLDDD